MPDGATADNNKTRTDDQPDGRHVEPGTAEEQVNSEVLSAEFLEFWRNLVGGDTSEHEAGGGGTGGQFMFANQAELNGVIKQWETEITGIENDRELICEAYYQIAEPAGDDMSYGVTDASRNSLAAMWDHSGQMLEYANNYVAKLRASSKQMAIMEDGAVGQVRSVQI